MEQIKLSQDEQRMRDECEREAEKQWPGARVLVEIEDAGFLAAVFLPEDGIDPDVSAVQARAQGSAQEALSTLLRTIKREQPRLH